MADNPLIGREPTKPGRVTEESLNDYAAALNRENWVKATGGAYFVNKRVDDKGVRHFLDRKI